MFDRYLIVETGLKNRTQDGRVVGFQFGARLPYYRGLGLSMVEDLKVSVDGEPVASEDVRLELRGRTWSLAQLETEYEERWEMGEVAQVLVAHSGGLSPGPHRLELVEQLRISYLPFPLIGKDTKTVTAG